MSFFRPTTSGEVARTGAAIAVFLVLPAVVPIVFQWKLYFTSDAHFYGVIAALVCGVPLGILFAAYVARLKRLQIHPHANTLRCGTYVVSFLSLVVSLYGWALLAQAVPLSWQSTQDLPYRIAALRQCSGKCGGCFYRIALKEWPGREKAELCFGKDFWESLKIDDEIVLRGKFSNHAIYIYSSTHPSAHNHVGKQPSSATSKN
ncbi:MAG TPA: hypothetical protein PKZ67_11860 [Accumulibacter sp.]|nr:hypothetical protein [Accumulibacter sp.]HNN46070.1 hypothetical protein [Azospira sp.]